MKKRIKAFSFAFSGLKAGVANEAPLRIHVTALVLVVITGIYCGLTRTEWITLILCSALVIAAELINTALEQICDHLSEQHCPRIKYIKDLGAAAVLVAVMAACVVGCLVFKSYLPSS